MRHLTILIALACFLATVESSACSCVPPPEDLKEGVARALERADLVFLGEAENVALDVDKEKKFSPMIQTSTFYVLESWKGEKVTRVTTKINIQCCVCGFSFDEGETYLIFGYEREDGFYSTSICSMSNRADRSTEVIEVLRELSVEE